MPNQAKKNKVFVMSDSDDEDNLNLKKTKLDSNDSKSKLIDNNTDINIDKT